MCECVCSVSSNDDEQMIKFGPKSHSSRLPGLLVLLSGLKCKSHANAVSPMCAHARVTAESENMKIISCNAQ